MINMIKMINLIISTKKSEVDYMINMITSKRKCEHDYMINMIDLITSKKESEPD